MTLRLEWLSPAELVENPRNWRSHPAHQLSALADLISEVGWAGACLYNERTGRLIDGHARRLIASQQGTKNIPVLVGDWSEEQEAKILATFDPIASLAEMNNDIIKSLLQDVQTGSDAIQNLLDSIDKKATVETPPEKHMEIKNSFNILIACDDEAQQTELLEEFTTRGFNCRSLIT
jgi:hypothetical protein